MPTSKRRKPRARTSEITEITARPQPISEELPKRAFAEEGLSVAPEDMGARFLADATEQGNFESLRPAELAEVEMPGPPVSDEPLVGPNIDVDESVWAQTVDLTLLAGSGDALTLDAASDDSFEEGEEDEDYDEDDENGVDLLGSEIREGSLLDQEADEPGETKAPTTNTDETTRRGRLDRTL